MNLLKRLSIQRYYKYKDEVIKRNAIASEVFVLVGLIVATVNMLSNIFIHRTNSYFGSLILLVYFVVAAILRPVIIKKHEKNSTLFLYLSQIPVIICGILMGTVFDPENITITFFLLLICMPVCILDNPLRHFLYTISMMILYLSAGFMFKDESIFSLDLVHALSFMMGAIFVDLFVLSERFDNIENYVLSERKARHDEMTGLKNRYALKMELDNFANKRVCAGILSIDYFKFFNDMFGHDFGEEMVSYLGKVTMETFGDENCYRFESDEILILDNKSSENEFKEKLQQMKEGFKEIIIRDKKFHPSCSIGFVYGTPVSGEDMSELIRHADVRLLEVKGNVRGLVMGFPYDKSQKRQTDILSEVAKTNDVRTLDEITGIPTMQFFRIRADEMLGNILDIGKKPSVAYFNIGNFKAYNEENGFRKGDSLLRSIADVIKEEFENRLIARFAEDHFVVLCYREEIEEKILNVIGRVKPLFGGINMTIKAGVAEFTEGENVGITCDKAKLACDSIKHEFGKSIEYYSDKLENRNRLQRYVVSHIDGAIERGYLRVYYQPIVDISTGKIIELEALARWIDPIHGFLSPGDFIPPLEESKLIHKIDRFISEQVCKDQEIVKRRAGYTVPVSINLSRLDFMITNVVESLKDIVSQNHVETSSIHLEVTESALVKDSEELKKKLNELKVAGFDIWLDDFGSGYSSLNSLQEFNFDVVKVDMRFMRTLESNPQTKIIVKSIIEMTKNLKLKSLVEGVETEAQYNFIKEIGVDLAQGFLFSRPVPLDELKFDSSI